MVSYNCVKHFGQFFVKSATVISDSFFLIPDTFYLYYKI